MTSPPRAASSTSTRRPSAPTALTTPTGVPAVNGRVYAMAASEDGSTLYLGGEFTTVDGAARARLAAVDATTGALITGWKANAPGEVSALAVSGYRLYVGGLFKKIDVSRHPAGWPRSAPPAASWTPASRRDRSQGQLFGRLSPDGQRLYAGGRFTTAARKPTVPASPSSTPMSGAATTFAPTGGGSARAVTLTPDGSRLFFQHPVEPDVAAPPGAVELAAVDRQDRG